MVIEVSVSPDALGTPWWESVVALAQKIGAEKEARVDAMLQRGHISAEPMPYTRPQCQLWVLVTGPIVLGPREVKDLLTEVRRHPGWQEHFLELRPVPEEELRGEKAQR